MSTGVQGLLFRSHASSKRNIIRNEHNWSTSRGFPPVVPWVEDTSSVLSGDGGIVWVWEVGLATRNYVEGRRGSLEEYPSTYTNGQEVRKTFQGK